MLGRPSTTGASLALAVGLLALVLTVAHAAVRYAPQTWIQRDGRFYVNVNTTLVEEASVEQDEFAASWYSGELGWNRNLDASWSNVALGRDGARLPKHPILLPLLSTPLFWAFGLEGTLLFNVLMFALIAAAAVVVGRRHGSVAAATFAGLALVLGTGIRDHAYDYHVDVLILALFTGGMAGLYQRRGLTAGLLLGATVVLRPTLLLWMPPLALILAERRDWRTMRRALVGGAVPLVLYALSNWWLFGAPWWTGYNRVLVVVNGEPQIADVGEAFSVPFEEGLRTLWEGPFGVRSRLTLMAAAAPGLLLLVRRRPLYVLAAVLGVAGSVVLFAKYRWYGDRFLWPSCALLVPALTATFEALARPFHRWSQWRAPTVAALGATAIAAAHLAAGAPLAQRFPTVGTEEILYRVLAVAAVAVGLCRATDRVLSGQPAAAVRRRAADRALPGSPFAIVAPLALFLLPGVTDRALGGGNDLWVAAFLCLALGARHWLPALAFSAAAAYLAGTSGDVGPAAILSNLGAGFGRVIVLLLVVAALGAPLMGRWVLLLAPLATLGLDTVATLGHGRMPLFALALACIPLTILCARTARAVVDRWRDASARARIGLPLAALGALLLLGAGRRVTEPPFRIATERGVREADVHLGHVPCDFLAWEHLNWECSTFDPGVHGETGLATSDPITVAAEDRGLFMVTTQRNMPRSVRWTGIEATDTLRLRYAVPDQGRGGGTLRVWIDDAQVSAIELPARADGTMYTEEVDTSAWSGEDVSLEIELAGRGAMVGVDGGFQ